MTAFTRLPLALAAALLFDSGAARAANPAEGELLQELKRLSARLEQVEQRNAELEKKLETTTMTGTMEQRVKSLEENQARVTKGLENENISENEPDLTSRLKAVEYQALGMQKQARTVEALEGITAGMSLTTTAQKASGVASDSAPNGASQLNYRGDVYVTLPLPAIGDTENRIFTQFRLGQGKGLNQRSASLRQTQRLSLPRTQHRPRQQRGDSRPSLVSGHYPATLRRLQAAFA